MNRIKFTSKTTMKLNKKPYKGYNLGEIPPSFGFDAKLDGINENGQDKFKYGINKWFNYKGLTWIKE
jgi:hypothetical protein|tara:strand:- start:649 stop:849 length:201 start_codon:yes stop_codon:yes gene_type:complete